MSIKNLFNAVTNSLELNEDWEKEKSTLYSKLLYNNVYVYITLIYGQYIEIGYGNKLANFVVFTTDDNDYNLEFTEQDIYNIAFNTEKIAKKYSLMIGG